MCNLWPRRDRRAIIIKELFCFIRLCQEGQGIGRASFIKAAKSNGGVAMAAAVKCVTAAAIEPSLSPSLCSFLSVFPRLMLAVSVCARQKRKKRKREAIKTQKNGSHLHTYLFSILHILKTFFVRHMPACLPACPGLIYAWLDRGLERSYFVHSQQQCSLLPLPLLLPSLLSTLHA